MKLRILSLFAVVLLSTSAFAQKTGEELFKENTCNACHMLTDMRLVGPGLQGVLERRERAWVKSWITNSTALIESGDAQAVALFEEYNKVPMTHYDLPEADLETLIDYIGGVEKAAAVDSTITAVVTPTAATTETKAEVVVEAPIVKEKSAFSKALDGRPLLASLFWSTLALLLLAIVAVLGVKIAKKN